MKKHLILVTLLSAAIAAAFIMMVKPRPLKLADNGVTDYVITSGSSEENNFAVGELKQFLKESTGIDFKSVPLEEASQYNHRIIVGNNILSEELLGKDLVASFKSDESLVMVKGNDLILTGEGVRGPAYAVYSFLENELGCRWYTAFKDSVIPIHESLTIGSLKRRETSAFEVRFLSQFLYQIRPYRDYFFFRNRGNKFTIAPNTPGIEGILPNIGPDVHTIFFYVEPGDIKNPNFARHPQPSTKNLFQSHPEFFSLNKAGKRVDTMQLCFSNPELRQTFTEHVEEVIKGTGRTRGVVSVDANDVPGEFCYCPECQKLREKYNTSAGPILDYLIELCGVLKEKHPGIYVKTLAYRKDQSEAPPENIAKLPENLIIIFAPIDDNFAQTLDHPSNKGTLENLKGWIGLSESVWVWYYPNPYIKPNPLMGNIKKLVHDIRIMRDIGVKGSFFEHDSGVATGYNFGELQTWLMMKLFQNPDQDADALVTEFTDFYYGAAAPLVRDFIEETEKLREELTIFLPWHPEFSHFRFYTPERIVRWEKSFDAMEALTKDNAKNLLHVRTSRIPLDITMLRMWQTIIREYPDIAITPRELHARILANFDAMSAERFPSQEMKTIHKDILQRDLPYILLQAENEPKALPDFFDQFPSDRIRRAFPTRVFPTKKIYPDPNAALGIAIGGAWDRNPITYGTYDKTTAKWGLTKTLPGNLIEADQYKFYKLGTTQLSTNCLIWVTEGWLAMIPLEQFYVEGYPFIKWDIYVSLKFEGPTYGSKNPETPNRISCDQVVLVRNEPDPATTEVP